MSEGNPIIKVSFSFIFFVGFSKKTMEKLKGQS